MTAALEGVSGQQHACNRKEGREKERKERERKEEGKRKKERKVTTCKGKGKVIPLQARCGPEGG